MTSMVRQFWWGQNNGKNKTTWISWDKICTPKIEGGLGFRDLRAFNLALLAKQGWCLQTHTSSLVHRVFKAKYFPEGDFLTATLGSSPLYAWRSIMAAQKIVQQGYRWQVGNGTSISVWTDKWLPTSSTFCITSHPHALPTDLRVSSLIDQETRQWRIGFIKENFPPQEAQTILSIPLSHRLPLDRLVWVYTPKGHFSVSSAYKVALSLKDNFASVNGGPFNTQNARLFWRTIWQLHIPSKIQSFTWRACKNVLSTKANLCSWNIIANATCEACRLDAETSGHVSWECEIAQVVWVSFGIPIQLHGIRFHSFLDLLWHLMLVQHVVDELLGLIVTIAWCLWHERNTARTGGTRQTSNHILQIATFLLEEFRSANHKFQPPTVPHTITWTPPNSPWYKINVDGAVFKQTQATGIGVVARDHEGQVIAAMSKKLWVPLGPLEAEVKAMEEGILFAWDVGLQDVIFEWLWTSLSCIHGYNYSFC